MQEIDRPKIIEVLQNKIEELKQKRVNLQQKKRAHPEDLDDLKSHFENDIQEAFVNRYAKATFLQCMLQEPPVLIASGTLHEIDKINQNKQKTLKNLLKETERIKSAIHDTEINIVKEDKNVALVEKTLEEISTKEKEVKRIKLELSGQGETVEGCQELLAQKSIELENLNKTVNERQDKVEDYHWKNHKTKRNIEVLKKKTEEKLEKAQMVKRLNTERDEGMEEQYYIYKNATDAIKKVTGVESIEYESSSTMYVTCNNAVIHIHIDLLNDKISDAFVEGSEIRIADLVKAVKGINVKDALSMLILETVARLRK